MTIEKIIRSLNNSVNIDRISALICAKDEYRLGPDCLSHMPLKETMLLKAYDHFTNIYIALYPFEDANDIKGVIAQALERKAFTCLKLALISKPILYNLLAKDYLNLALTYAKEVKSFNVFRANIYLGLSIHALSNNDLIAAETNLAAGYLEIKSQDDLAANEIKQGLNECLKQYKFALKLVPGSKLTKASEVTECGMNEYSINTRGM